MMMPCRVEPATVRLMTWEWKTAFEDAPSEKELREAFKKDLPQSSARMDAEGECFRMWPMVSFNSAEGRCFRYLVAIYPKKYCGKKWYESRKLPWQIWIYGCADRLLRNADEMTSSGNGLFYAVENQTLYLAVFCEGRLCHWSEESGYEEVAVVENRLDRFRKFLKGDSYFSRWEYFPEYCLNEVGCREREFRWGVLDPFWKGKCLEDESRKPWPLAVILVAVLMVLLPLDWPGENLVVPDVAPPELVEYEMEFQETEMKARIELPRMFSHERKRECEAPGVNLQGIFAGRLFLADGKNYFLGDSIGNQEVVEIGRDFVSFRCGKNISQVKMGRL